MSVFLLSDPDAVFIHIPKTAGRSIRVGAWEGRYQGPVRGAIPSEWAGYFKFAFARHPIDRLISAWLMFSEGRTLVPQMRQSKLLALVGIKHSRLKMKSHAPLFPGISLSNFLDIAMDETIGFDEGSRGIRKRKAVLRRHAIPQTHPYNCIDAADFVGRFERLNEDIGVINARLGSALVLPVTNKTRSAPEWRSQFTPELLERAIAYYREDFDRFGYEIPKI